MYTGYAPSSYSPSRSHELSPQAIDFAKEQNDDDLWEDLLKYSETRPSTSFVFPLRILLLMRRAAFIRGLLENVGAEISPLRLIRRIKNGLEIPGLKEALIKILQDFHLQISLLDGCQAILNGDSADFARTLHRDQTAGFFVTGARIWVVFRVVRGADELCSEDGVSDLRALTAGDAAGASRAVSVPARCTRGVHARRGASPAVRARRGPRAEREDCIVSPFPPCATS